MERPRQLFREFGLTLALLLAAALICWKTTLPALKKNSELDRRHLEMLDQQERLRAEQERLRELERGKDDPETIERVHAEQHGEMGLPANEHTFVPAPGPGARNDH